MHNRPLGTNKWLLVADIGDLMEHFSVVQTLCRIGLESQDVRFRKQVERLRERLVKDGDEKAASVLERLLTGTGNEHAMTPSAVEVSRSLTSENAKGAAMTSP